MICFIGIGTQYNLSHKLSKKRISYKSLRKNERKEINKQT